MLKILIVEDDEKLSQLYKIVLTKAGYETVLAANGQEAWDIFDTEHIDMVITDVMMPVLNGYDFVKILRQENPLIPVLMITAKDDYPSKSKGFTLGIDDYMTKPIDVNEMVLRVKALLRRANINQDRKLVVGGTSLDYDSLTVSSGENSFMLPHKEFLLLYKLISYPNKIFTRIQLMNEIWGPDTASDAQTVDVHINRLRRHFEDNKDFEIITVRGLGYKAVIR
ncbi:response regulator transcription factor [Enterocloster asparagiformis]|uniref:response regulator transcription factor n=1 Tax=Enterocloster asparagiformis TaxID=333367 RepID=UPI0004655520|nr:response regulator transcription factor [Enterocloster asparagiformis]